MLRELYVQFLQLLQHCLGSTACSQLGAHLEENTTVLGGAQEQ